MILFFAAKFQLTKSTVFKSVIISRYHEEDFSVCLNLKAKDDIKIRNLLQCSKEVLLEAKEWDIFSNLVGELFGKKSEKIFRESFSVTEMAGHVHKFLYYELEKTDVVTIDCFIKLM